jgi:hypothetical protein
MKRGRSASNELVRFGTANVNRQQRQLVCVVACKARHLGRAGRTLLRPEAGGRPFSVSPAN